MNKKVFCIFLLFFLFCILSLFLFNKIADKQYGKKDLITENTNVLNDYNNVSTVDSKLGEPYAITMGYLKNYAKKKSGIWYQSEAMVDSISSTKEITTLTLRDITDKEKTIQVFISNIENIKKNDIVHFVGTINLEDFSLSLAKIAKEEISYQKATPISFTDLVTNLSLLKKQEFLVYGYLVKEGNMYLLYDSVEEYQNNSNTYFVVNWEEEILLENEDNKQISCQLKNSYSLKNCKLK